MLCVYQALCDLITQAADRAGIDPDRISFKSALDAARRPAGTALPPPAAQACARPPVRRPHQPARPQTGRSNQPTCGETTLFRTLPQPRRPTRGPPRPPPHRPAPPHSQDRRGL